MSADENAFAGNISTVSALIGGIMDGVLCVVVVTRPSAQLVTIVTAAIGSGLVGSVVSPIMNVSYFPEASTGAQWWTLIAWIVGGVAVLLIGVPLKHTKDAKPAALEAPVAA